MGMALIMSVQLMAQSGPSFAFDKGVEVVAPDSSLSLRFQFNMQNRIDLNTASTDDWSVDEFKARVRRFRLKFSGFIINPRLTYKIQLAMAPGVVKDATSDQAPQVLHDAMIYYQMSPRLQLGFGQGKVPGDHQMISSSADLQLVDRSLHNSVFNVGRDFGLLAEYKPWPSALRPIIFHGSITAGEGRNWVKSEGSGFSYGGRLDWYPLGMFKTAYKEGDLEWHAEPALMLGLAYNFNDNAQRTGGQQGSLLYQDRDISTVYFDMTFKQQGWASQFAFSFRNSDDPVTIDPTENSIRYVYQGNGYHFQVSKYFRSNYEVVGRIASVTPGSAIDELEPERREWTLGLNRYIKGRSIKLQTDLTLHQSRAQNRNFSGWMGFRFQAQIGF